MAQPKRAATLARWGTTLVMHAGDRPDCALGAHESLRQQRGSAIARLAFKRTQESGGFRYLLRRDSDRSSELVLRCSEEFIAMNSDFSGQRSHPRMNRSPSTNIKSLSA